MEHSSTSLRSPAAQSLTVTLEEVQSSQFQAEQIPLAALQEPIVSSASQPSDAVQPQDSESQRGNATLSAFFSTFLTIFLAELGDKTQVTTLLMSAESHAPWTVFIGAGTALVATSLIGVWLGCWLAKRVSPKTLETAAGYLLLFVAAQLLWDVIHLS